jgi:hypothetical protein
LNEGVVICLLTILISPINEYAFDIAMTLSTGVTSVVDSLREVIDTTKASSDGLHLELRELRSLIQEDDIVLNTLESVKVFVIVTVGKIDCRAIGELKHLILVIVLGYSKQLFTKDIDVVVYKLRIGSTDYKDTDACKV